MGTNSRVYDKEEENSRYADFDWLKDIDLSRRVHVSCSLPLIYQM